MGAQFVITAAMFAATILLQGAITAGVFDRKEREDEETDRRGEAEE